MDITGSNIRKSFFEFIEIIPFAIVMVLQLMVTFIAMILIGIGFLLITMTDWIQKQLD